MLELIHAGYYENYDGVYPSISFEEEIRLLNLLTRKQDFLAEAYIEDNFNQDDWLDGFGLNPPIIISIGRKVI